MATSAEMTRAASRRARILDHIRDTVTTTWSTPHVKELAERENVDRATIHLDLAVLEREGYIVQDTTTTPRRMRLAGHTLTITRDDDEADR